MTKLIYGNGTILTHRGEINGEGKCLTLTDTGIARPVGSTLKEWEKERPQETHDVVLVFKSLESARTLQDELNEMISEWSRELSEKV